MTKYLLPPTELQSLIFFSVSIAVFGGIINKVLLKLIILQSKGMGHDQFWYHVPHDQTYDPSKEWEEFHDYGLLHLLSIVHLKQLL